MLEKPLVQSKGSQGAQAAGEPKKTGPENQPVSKDLSAIKARIQPAGKRKKSSTAAPGGMSRAPQMPCRPVPEIDFVPRINLSHSLQYADSDLERNDTESATVQDKMTPLADLYGVVELTEAQSESVFKIGSGSKPVVHLCHLEDATDSPREALSRKTSEAGLKLKAMEDEVRERRELRQMRRTSREESRRVSRVEGPETSDNPERSCRKHSKCHCYLFAVKTDGFFSVL